MVLNLAEGIASSPSLFASPMRFSKSARLSYMLTTWCTLPYVYLDGIVLRRTWADQVRNVSVLVAVGVAADGYRKILHL